MGQSTNHHRAADDQVSSRVIEEITFQASILALRAAVESAAMDGCLAEGDAVQEIEDSIHSLVERARQPGLRGH